MSCSSSLPPVSIRLDLALESHLITGSRLRDEHPEGDISYRAASQRFVNDDDVPVSLLRVISDDLQLKPHAQIGLREHCDQRVLQEIDLR